MTSYQKVGGFICKAVQIQIIIVIFFSCIRVGASGLSPIDHESTKLDICGNKIISKSIFKPTYDDKSQLQVKYDFKSNADVLRSLQYFYPESEIQYSNGPEINLPNLTIDKILENLNQQPKNLVKLTVNNLTKYHYENGVYKSMDYDSKLFDTISKFSELEYLNLDSNELNNIGSSLKNLKKLKHLTIYQNSLQEFPEYVFDLPNLEYLSLNSNKISNIPTDISKLKNLKTLDLGLNNFTQIPEEIGFLPNLEVLVLNNFEYAHKLLTRLPESIGCLKNLKKLDLNDSFVLGSDFPKQISKLKNLVQLEIGGNNFHNIPKEFFNLSNLEYLDLRYTRPHLKFQNLGLFYSTKLPKSLENLQNLRKIRMICSDIGDDGSLDLSKFPKLEYLENRGWGCGTLGSGNYNYIGPDASFYGKAKELLTKNLEKTNLKEYVFGAETAQEDITQLKHLELGIILVENKEVLEKLAKMPWLKTLVLINLKDYEVQIPILKQSLPNTCIEIYNAAPNQNNYYKYDKPKLAYSDGCEPTFQLDGLFGINFYQKN